MTFNNNPITKYTMLKKTAAHLMLKQQRLLQNIISVLLCYKRTDENYLQYLISRHILMKSYCSHGYLAAIITSREYYYKYNSPQNSFLTRDSAPLSGCACFHFVMPIMFVTPFHRLLIDLFWYLLLFLLTSHPQYLMNVPLNKEQN